MQFFGYHMGGDGALFHREGKTQLCQFLEGFSGFTDLVDLVVKSTWLEEKDDLQMTPNIALIKQMREVLLEEIGPEIPIIERKALRIFTNWLIVLYKNDLFYMQRIGWMIAGIIEYSDLLDDPREIIQHIERNYFAFEVRKNRVPRMKQIFFRFWEAYDAKPWVQKAVQFTIDYLAQHGEKFNWDIPGEKKEFSIFDPRNWLGGPTGFMIVNAGEG